MQHFEIRSATPARAVPPGRLGYDLDADDLLLHTFQTADAVDILSTTGVLRADPALVATEWPAAYSWMIRKMNERLPDHAQRPPIWLWAKTTRRDLVSSCRFSRGQVLLTCRVSRDRVLLSQFDEWHAALNSTLSIRPLADETEWDFDARYDNLIDDLHARLDAAGLRHAPIDTWPSGLRDEVERSWEVIFDRSRFDKSESWQATVHELRVADVADAVLILP